MLTTRGERGGDKGEELKIITTPILLTSLEERKERERERERVTLTLLFSLLINCIKELETILPSHTPHNMNWRNIFIKEALVILRKNTHR